MVRLENIAAAHAGIMGAALTTITLTLSNQVKVMLRNPHVPGQDVHAHQHGMAGLESTAVERVSVANPALSPTTLCQCDMANRMADHTSRIRANLARMHEDADA